MRLKKIPRSRAKTAWGLCQEVIKAIEAEPKRADMTIFSYKLSPEEGGPACGTVGCFAGWVTLLKDGHMTDSYHRAIEILGDLEYYTIRDDTEDPLFVFNGGLGDRCDTDITSPRTKAHMRAVVSRIKKFMKINAAALKSRNITGV